MMNTRLVLRNSDDKLVYCVLDGERDTEEQLKEVFSLRAGYGFTVRVTAQTVAVVDGFHADTVASWDIVAYEDTGEDVYYQLRPVE